MVFCRFTRRDAAKTEESGGLVSRQCGLSDSGNIGNMGKSSLEKPWGKCGKLLPMDTVLLGNYGLRSTISYLICLVYVLI